MNFQERWIDFLYRSAMASRRTRALLTPLGAIVFFAFVAAFIVGAAYCDRFFAFPPLLPAPYQSIVGGVLLVLGVVAVGWCNKNFFKAHGTPVPLNPPQELVCVGPHAVIRNPILAGLFAAMFGVGFLMNSISLVAFFTPLFILVNVVEIKMIEEPELEKRFGDSYLEYKKRTPMFFPRLFRRRIDE